MARVLIVDSARDTRELLAHQVTRLGHQALTGADDDAGEAEVILLEAGESPQLALARQRALAPAAAIVIVSIYPRATSLAALGVSDYLLQPCSPAELARALDSALASRLEPALS